MSSTFDDPKSMAIIQHLKKSLDETCKTFLLPDWNDPDSWGNLKNDLSIHMNEWMKYSDLDDTISRDINKSGLPDRIMIGILKMCEGFEHVNSMDDLRKTISEIHFNFIEGLSISFKQPIRHIVIEINLTDKEEDQ